MDAPWDELEAYLSQTLEFADGRQLGIAGFAIDTGGHHTNRVYKWSKAMKKKGKKCYAIKGYSNKEDIPLIYKRTVVGIKEDTKDGKGRVVDRTVIYILGVDAGKEDISNRLKITEPGEGYCHFPKEDGRGYGAAYYEGLTSEHKVIRQVRGKLISSWEKESGKRNEPFDLLNYNYAVLELIHPEWDVLEAKLQKGINYMQARKTGTTVRRNQKGIEV
jgi:phage terminase large subunit GpA-like protein